MAAVVLLPTRSTPVIKIHVFTEAAGDLTTIQIATSKIYLLVTSGSLNPHDNLSLSSFFL